MIVVIENTGSAIARHVDIRPPIVVEIERRNAEGVVSARLIYVRLGSYIHKRSISSILVQTIFRAG